MSPVGTGQGGVEVDEVPEEVRLVQEDLKDPGTTRVPRRGTLG